MSGLRSERVAETIRAYLTRALREDLNDPRLNLLVVTSIEVNADLAVAHVSVRLLSDDGNAKARSDVMRCLARAVTRLRRGLAPKLKLRKTPELRFRYDDAHDHVARIEAVLREIASEPLGEPPEPEPEGSGEP